MSSEFNEFPLSLEFSQIALDEALKMLFTCKTWLIQGLKKNFKNSEHLNHGTYEVMKGLSQPQSSIS